MTWIKPVTISVRLNKEYMYELECKGSEQFQPEPFMNMGLLHHLIN